MNNNAISFPVGYHRFHKTQIFNFQLKRWYSIGQAQYEDWKTEMIRIFEFFMRYENLFNKISFMKIERNPRMKWEIGNTMRITKSETPIEGAQLNLSLSRENLHADLIQQYVLFFSGQDDHASPSGCTTKKWKH